APAATAPDSADAQSATGASGVTLAAVTVPVGALAAALRQTVSESGLFYESHLAQWLSGQRSPSTLADEPQNRLFAQAAQLPLDWALGGDTGADGEGLASWWHGGSPAQPGGAPQQTGAAQQGPSGPMPMAARFAAAVQEFAEDAFGAGSSNPAVRGGGTTAGVANSNAGSAQASAPQAQMSTQAMAASVHPATVTLVRQQLDLLATGEFRWSGEAWPGARLDWTIEERGDRWSRGGATDSPEEEAQRPWRTRLTLSLPVLGTVDADLTLVGTQLTARVQASPSGAARLAAQGESFRRGLAAVGIALNALAIREIVGGGPSGGVGPGFGPLGGAAATEAAQAYARSASAADAAHAANDTHTGRYTPPVDLFDGDVLL
ncbi:flagellar hook-length control protein FliK, partial [Paraburkholderia solisilvae]